MTIIFKILLLLSLFISASPRAERFVYITDKVDIPFRSEKKISHDNLLNMLPSGTKLQIISTQEGWTQVKFEKTNGWVLSRYLANNPPARKQLKKLKRTHNANKLIISKQKQENKTLQKKLKSLKKANAKLTIQSAKAQAESKHMKKVYENSLELEYTKEKLAGEILQLKTEIQLLENNQLSKQENSARNWFIIGAIVLFLGILLGFILTKFNTQRRI